MDSPTCTAILVVEDEDTLRKVVVEFLETQGFQVYQAENGGQALRVLAQMPRPALVLADLMMPAIDGPSLISALSADDRFAILPVVVVPSAESGVPARYSRDKQPISLDDLLRITISLCLRRN
jgi:CheY-like chemotaxis protein